MGTTIKKLNRPAVAYIKKRLKTTLKPLAEELGVVIDLGRVSFRSTNGRFPLKLAVLDCDGEPITEEIDSFRRDAKSFGFEATDLGRDFVVQGRSYTICGLSPKSWKYPVIARSVRGREHKFPCQTVIKALGKETPDSHKTVHDKNPSEFPIPVRKALP